MILVSDGRRFLNVPVRKVGASVGDNVPLVSVGCGGEEMNLKGMGATEQSPTMGNA